MIYLILITLRKEWSEGVSWTGRKSDITFTQIDLTYNNLGKLSSLLYKIVSFDLHRPAFSPLSMLINRILELTLRIARPPNEQIVGKDENNFPPFSARWK